VVPFQRLEALPGPMQLRPAGIEFQTQMLILDPERVGFILEAEKLFKFSAIHGGRIIPLTPPLRIAKRGGTVNSYVPFDVPASLLR
jgi:hypothetical protein